MSTKFGVNNSALQPKSVILSWINTLLKVDLTKIEELGSGNVYCQILDVVYPGHVPLLKVKWKAKTENDFIHNFKILQGCFDNLKIDKVIPLQKLAQAKYQDNLEFIQWMKKFFDVNCKEKGKGYNPLQRRNKQQPDFSWIKRGVPPKFTLVYSHNSKITNKSQMISESQSQTQETEQTHEPICVDKVEKKVKPNLTATPMRTFFRQSSMPETNRATVTPNAQIFRNSNVPDNFECKFFLKKPNQDDEQTQKLDKKEDPQQQPQILANIKNIQHCKDKENHEKDEKQKFLQINQEKDEKLVKDIQTQRIQIENKENKENIYQLHHQLFNSTSQFDDLLLDQKTPEKTDDQALLNTILEIIQKQDFLNAHFKVQKIKDLLL